MTRTRCESILVRQHVGHVGKANQLQDPHETAPKLWTNTDNVVDRLGLTRLAEVEKKTANVGTWLKWVTLQWGGSRGGLKGVLTPETPRETPGRPPSEGGGT